MFWILNCHEIIWFEKCTALQANENVSALKETQTGRKSQPMGSKIFNFWLAKVTEPVRKAMYVEPLKPEWDL